jgi:hypothetical protein
MGIAERQTFRGLREKNSTVLQQGAERYLLQNRRVSAIEAVLAAITEIGTFTAELQSRTPSAELCGHIKTVLVAGKEFKLDLQVFRQNVLAAVFSPDAISRLASPQGVREEIWKGLYDTHFSDADFDLAIKTVAQNTGIPEAAEPFLKQKQLYPSLDEPLGPLRHTNDAWFDEDLRPVAEQGYRERPHLFVPVALPPFSAKSAGELTAAVAAALDTDA